MSRESRAVVSRQETGSGTLMTYSVGFVASIILTISAYLLVVSHKFTGWSVILAIVCLAVAQLAVQLMFFLHLGRESKPRWNLTVMMFALLVVLIVVLGSLWIMSNLNYHHSHLSPAATDQFIIKDEGIQE